MEIKDLSLFYQDYNAGRSSLSKYLSSHPFFFEHYLKFWGTGNPSFANISSTQMEENRTRVLRSINKAVELLSKLHFDLKDLEIILFVGQNTCNGHACLLDGKPTVYIALESYTSDLYSDVFCMHEIIHGLHYQQQPRLLFNSVVEKALISRQLLAEGMATYLTKSILDVSADRALWADFLDDAQLKKWNQNIEANHSLLNNLCIDNFQSSDLTLSSKLFAISDLTDARRSRAGYKIGMLAIESIVKSKNIPVKEIFKITESDLFEALMDMR